MGWTSKGSARRRRRTEVLERPQYGWIWKPLLVLLVVYLLVTLALGIWWSRTPEAPMPVAGSDAAEVAGDDVVGTVPTLRATLTTLLDKPGGYLRNDLAPPGLWLDNMPAWEKGVLEQSRGLIDALPAIFPDEPEPAKAAAVSLRGDGRDWFYPSTEHHLGEAIKALEPLNGAAVVSGSTQPVADWLGSVAQDLDALGSRLSASVGDRKRLATIGVAVASLPEPTPWYRVDNVFFEARGQTWALRHLLAAVRQDHREALASAGITEQWDRLTVELERSQRRLWSPVILNGSGFGVFANHSLVMASHVLRARDLTLELSQSLEAAGSSAESTDSAAPTGESGQEASSMASEPAAP